MNRRLAWAGWTLAEYALHRDKGLGMLRERGF
jgi:hypothetical protein